MSDIFRGLGKPTIRSLACALMLTCAPAFAAQVRGSVDAPVAPPAQLSLGYTKTRVATQGVHRGPARADVAVFLAAKESGVIPPPTEPFKVSIAGLELEPSISACVIDGKVAFTNQDSGPMTVMIEDQALGTIPPGQTVVYECKTGEPKTRRVRIKEWPHVRGGLFVGEVGVVAAVNANGAFSMAAPTGKYEVQVISEAGPVSTKPVEVKGADVDVGRLSAAREGAAEPEKTVDPAKEKEAPPVAPVAPKKQPAVKKEPAGEIPVPVLPKREQLKKKEIEPSEDAPELEFGEE